MLRKLDNLSLNRKQWKFLAGIAGIVAAAVFTAALVLATIAIPVMARVNGEVITEEDVVKLRAKVYQSQRIQLSEEEALEQLVVEILLYQEAERLGRAPTMEEAEHELEARVASSGRTMEDFEADLAKSGFSYEEYLQDFQRQLAINSYLDDAVQVSEVTELEARVFYEDYKQQYPGAELPPFEQLKSEIMAFLQQQKRQEAIVVLIDELREQANIRKYN